MHTKKREISADIFRAYDIRGIYNDDLYPETMLKIGLGLGTYAKERSETSVVVGNDIRTTSPLLANALISGLLSSGVDVTNVGTTSFGVSAFSGWLLKKDIIAYVTASHLPPEWNGVKFYSGAGIGFSAAENGKIRDIVLYEKEVMVSWPDAVDGKKISYEILPLSKRKNKIDLDRSYQKLSSVLPSHFFRSSLE